MADLLAVATNNQWDYFRFKAFAIDFALELRLPSDRRWKVEIEGEWPGEYLSTLYDAYRRHLRGPSQREELKLTDRPERLVQDPFGDEAEAKRIEDLRVINERAFARAAAAKQAKQQAEAEAERERERIRKEEERRQRRAQEIQDMRARLEKLEGEANKETAPASTVAGRLFDLGI